jgi:hypothetical protein
LAQKLTPTVKCEVCFERYKSLPGHLKTHGLNAKKYREQFVDAPVVSPLTRRRMQLSRLKFILKKKGEKTSKELTGRSLKLSIANTGKKHSEETKEKIRQARLGSKLSEEHKLAISAGLLGHEVSDETRLKLSQVVVSDERRKRISESQSAEKSNSWKGGRSRHLYFGKGKFRLKKIFGDPIKCFFPGCDKVEGKNVKSVDCHHLDGNHENNPLDGSNWLPLCRRHHMLADGRLKSASEDEIRKARDAAYQVHKDHMKHHYVGEIKTYHE